MMLSRSGVAALAVAALLTTADLPPADSSRPPAATWLEAAAGHRWEFPRDHWAHPGFRNEWWYFTGHLQARQDDGRRFGFQFTLFRIGRRPSVPDLDSDWASRGWLMGHAALTDLTTGEHHFTEVLWRETAILAGFSPPGEHPMAWSRAPAGSPGLWVLDWNGTGFDLEMHDDSLNMGLQLSTRPVKPMVLHGDAGFSPKSREQGAGSLYYSFTRLRTEGEVTLNGRAVVVEGESWMDKEFSSQHLSPGQVGWDWFSLQLADGRELMLYILRGAAGAVDHASGTLVAADGTSRTLEPTEWELVTTASWRSPITSTDYPAAWHLTIPGAGLNLLLRPEVEAQENRSVLGGLTYWEGALAATDTAGEMLGRGYAELTGYGRDNRPPL